MTRLVWLQLELVATSLDLSWPPNSPLSPRPINTIKWISKEVLSSPCHRWRIPALDTIYAPILSSPRFLQITFPQLRMTAVTLAPFTKPISFPEAAILMYSDGGSLVTEALGTRLQWNQSQDCFSTHVTINYQFFFRAWQVGTNYIFSHFWYHSVCFPALMTIYTRRFPSLGTAWPVDWLHVFPRFLLLLDWLHVSVFPRFLPLLDWLLVFPHFSPLLDRLQVMRFLPSFIRLQVFPRFSSLPDWLHVFLRISPWFIRLHVFQRFSPLVNWLQVYPRFSPLLYWLHVFLRFLPTLVPFQVYPLSSALLDWLHAFLRFSPVSDHCLTGYVFLRFSPLLDPGSKTSLTRQTELHKI